MLDLSEGEVQDGARVQVTQLFDNFQFSVSFQLFGEEGISQGKCGLTMRKL